MIYSSSLRDLVLQLTLMSYSRYTCLLSRRYTAEAITASQMVQLCQLIQLVIVLSPHLVVVAHLQSMIIISSPTHSDLTSLFHQMSTKSCTRPQQWAMVWFIQQNTCLVDYYAVLLLFSIFSEFCISVWSLTCHDNFCTRLSIQDHLSYV